MSFTRASGILLHPTSLPSRFGIGALGQSAYNFVDFLVETGQKIWQVMPLGLTGFSDSPYASFSAFAGNHLLISLEKLEEYGLLKGADIDNGPSFPDDKVIYNDVIKFKNAVLKKSFENFVELYNHPYIKEQRDEFLFFCQRNAWWLDDYALFMALKETYDNHIWSTWDIDIVKREPNAIKECTKKLEEKMDFHKYIQYKFFKQWLDLKQYANKNGVRIIGDIPIFVAYDSADVWANQHLFYLDENRKSTVVAGVPPDYFSETGQLWGNPLYRWDVMKEENYEWWIKRFAIILNVVDIVRIDHFRGFEAYWEVPATEKTAVKGQWVKGPGKDLFYTIEKDLGKLPIIAEDLGFLTPEVHELRDTFEFPGMTILQFAFSSDATNPYLPHNFSRNCVVYTGTHDNDTTIGWFKTCPKTEKKYSLKYLGTNGKNIHWDFIKMGMSSVADTAIFPLQDVLGLGTEARMNTPSTESGNWSWRFTADMITPEIKEKLKDLAITYGRYIPETKEEEKDTADSEND